MAGETSDPTKSLWYVACDLTIKSLSALGVITLGFVGWQLQSDSQSRSAADKTTELRAALFLPAVQVMSQLQVAFSIAAENADLGLTEERVGNANIEGWKLQYLAGSLHLPPGFSDVIHFVPLDKYRHGRLLVADTAVSYRAASAMAAEVWQNLPALRAVCARAGQRPQPGDVQLFANAPTLYFAQVRGQAMPGDEMVFLGAESFPAWKVWFPTEGTTAVQMCNVDFRQLFHDVALGGAALSGQIMATYPMIAEKAVALRMQALRGESDLQK